VCAWLISPFPLPRVLSINHMLAPSLSSLSGRACSLSAHPHVCESSERRKEDEEQERKWGKTAAKHGAMGDVVSDVLTHFQ